MNTDLYSLLKQKRQEISDREGLELFKVFQNAVLQRTAEARPKNRKDLESIKGWGVKKIEKYGDEILAVINGGSLKPQTLFPGWGAEVAVKKTEKKQQSVPEESGDIFSVKEFIDYLNNRFSQMGVLKVRGEIIQVSRKDANYCFFDIKDPLHSEHIISCIIWRSALTRYGYLLEPGMEVVVSAVPSVYKSGKLSIIVEKVEAFGQGALQKAFEMLKAKMEEKGYFDQSRKRPIPSYVKNIGLITSESGAAVRDFQTNLGEYGFSIQLVDVRVEGDYSERSIVSAMHWLNKNKPDLDIIVLLRGGGSLENFKAFNSEKVAEAIVLSRLPVITGIGHERDQSIADLCSDLALSTPTATAVYLKTQRQRLLQQISIASVELNASLGQIVQDSKERVASIQFELTSAYEDVVNTVRAKLIRHASKMQQVLGGIFMRFKSIEQEFIHSFYKYHGEIRSQLHRLSLLSGQSTERLATRLQKTSGRIGEAGAVLKQLNPEAILKKGYSIAYNAAKQVIKNAHTLKKGESITIALYKGQINTTIEEILD